MKNQYNILAGILLTTFTMAFAACTKDRTAQVEELTPVNFTTGITTRVAANQWEQGDRIGIFMIAQGTKLSTQSIVGDANNRQYLATAGVTATLTPESPGDRIYFPQNGEAVDFIGYHPHLSDSRISGFTIEVDAVNQGSSLAPDLLYSDNAVGLSKSNAVVNMIFRHVMTKLSVNITLASEFEGASVDLVTITGCNAIGSFSLATAEWTSKEVATVTTYRTDDNFSAHIIPQDAAGERLIVINIGETVYTYPIVEELAQGKMLTYNLVVGREGVLEAEVTIADWIGNGIETEPAEVENAQINIDWQGYHDTEFKAIEILGGDDRRYASAVAPTSDGLMMVTSELIGADIQNIAPKQVWVYYMDYKIEIPVDNFSYSGGVLTLDYGIVATREHLENINNALSRNYIQIRDIDLENNDFIPIGTEGQPFTGTYDGGGFKIENLNINLPDGHYIGLFGSCNNSTLKNIYIASGSVIGNSRVGGICGKCETADGKMSIENCVNFADVSGGTQVSGICGCFYIRGIDSEGDIISCINSGNVTASGNSCGGICGETMAYESGKIVFENCVNTGELIVVSYSGGICGINGANSMGSSTIIGCCNSGGILPPNNAGNRIGGICGDNNGNNNGEATIVECYNAAAVLGVLNIGGICGSNSQGGTITCCFWGKGAVADTSPIQIIGRDNGGTMNLNYQFSGTDWPGTSSTPGYWELAPAGRWATLGSWGGTPEDSEYPQLNRNI